MSTLHRINSDELEGFMKADDHGGWDSFLQPETILSNSDARISSFASGTLSDAPRSNGNSADVFKSGQKVANGRLPSKLSAMDSTVSSTGALQLAIPPHDFTTASPTPSPEPALSPSQECVLPGFSRDLANDKRSSIPRPTKVPQFSPALSGTPPTRPSSAGQGISSTWESSKLLRIRPPGQSHDGLAPLAISRPHTPSGQMSRPGGPSASLQSDRLWNTMSPRAMSSASTSRLPARQPFSFSRSPQSNAVFAPDSSDGIQGARSTPLGTPHPTPRGAPGQLGSTRWAPLSSARSSQGSVTPPAERRPGSAGGASWSRNSDVGPGTQLGGKEGHHSGPNRTGPQMSPSFLPRRPSWMSSSPSPSLSHQQATMLPSQIPRAGSAPPTGGATFNTVGTYADPLTASTDQQTNRGAPEDPSPKPPISDALHPAFDGLNGEEQLDQLAETLYEMTSELSVAVARKSPVADVNNGAGAHSTAPAAKLAAAAALDGAQSSSDRPHDQSAPIAAESAESVSHSSVATAEAPSFSAVHVHGIVAEPELDKDIVVRNKDHTVSDVSNPVKELTIKKTSVASRLESESDKETIQEAEMKGHSKASANAPALSQKKQGGQQPPACGCACVIM